MRCFFKVSVLLLYGKTRLFLIHYHLVYTSSRISTIIHVFQPLYFHQGNFSWCIIGYSIVSSAKLRKHLQVHKIGAPYKEQHITVWLQHKTARVQLKQTAECKYVSRLSQYSSQWPLLCDSVECPAVGPQWGRCWGDYQTRWQLLVGSPRHSLLGHATPTFQRDSWDSHRSPQWEGTHQGIDH